MITKKFERVKNKIGGAPAKRADGKARAGREGKGVWGKGIPAPPERKMSKVGVGIFAEKSSDFVQKRQPISKVCVSRLARGFAPRFGKRIFKQFPIESTFFARGAKAKRQFIPTMSGLPKSDIK